MRKTTFFSTLPPNRNFLLNSKGPFYKAASYNVWAGFLSVGMVPWAPYTFSIKCTKGASKRISVWLNNGNTNLAEDIPLIGDDIYSLTISQGSTNKSFNVYQEPGTSPLPFTIEWLKLEAGSVMTPWIPAIEDGV